MELVHCAAHRFICVFAFNAVIEASEVLPGHGVPGA